MIKSYALFKGKYALVWLAVGLLAGMVLATTVASPSGAKAGQHTTGLETVVINPIEVDAVPGTSRSKEEVWIYGSSFTPGQEVHVLVQDGYGVFTEISVFPGSRRDGGGSVYPLIVNDQGAWVTNWRLGRFTRGLIAPEAITTLHVVDDNFNTLASTPIAFCNISGRAAALEADPATEVEVPPWCSA